MEFFNYHSFPSYEKTLETYKTELSISDQTVLKVSNLFYTGETTFSCDIKAVSTDIYHIGLWLFNAEENYWIPFAYQGSGSRSLNIWDLPNSNPRNSSKSFRNLKQHTLDSSLNIEEFQNFKIQVKNNVASFYLNNSKLYETDFNFEKYCFGIFSYGSVMYFKNIWIDSLDLNKNFLYSYWRISNIENRRKDQTYRSVGNILFKAKTGELSNNSSYGFSESHFSQETLPGNAFDGLDSTYTLSSSLEDGTNTQEHGDSWWVGYKFLNPVEIESVDISMRYDMEGVVDNLIDNSLGQEWTSFQIDGSEDGLEWFSVFRAPDPKIFKNDTSAHNYSLPKGDKVYAKFWKIANLQALNGESTWRSFAELRFNTFDNQPFNNLSKLSISGNGSDGVDSSDKSYLIDGNPNTRWTNMNKDAFVSYEFDTPTYIESIDIQPRNDRSYGQELQTADIFYSYDGTSWLKYGSISPNIPLNDMSMVKNIPVQVITRSEFQYQSKVSEENKFKFWRCMNIKSLGSLSSPVDYRSQSIINFINYEDTKLINKFNSFSSSEYTNEPGQGLTINSFDNSEDTWSANGAINENSILAAENYSIGCMFNSPVDVYKFGYKPRKGQDVSWGQTWSYCNIQYSDNGFDWYDKGFCELNIPRLDFNYSEIEIQPIPLLDRYKFWRVAKVFLQNSGDSIGFDGWELRFNTLTGEVSNISTRGFSANSWSDYWYPSRAFDGVVNTNAGGFHPKPENDVQFFVGYEFKEPQIVNSISVLMRRDHNRHNWVFATIEASEDNVNWMFKGYAEINSNGVNNRFFTNILESKNPLDRLTMDYLSPYTSISFKELEFKPFGPILVDTNNISINIYNKDNDGTISGEVTELDIPVIREVGLYDRATRQLIAITWSDEKGQYKFTGIDSTRKYYVHAIDSNDFYNAVTQDMIEPLI